MCRNSHMPHQVTKGDEEHIRLKLNRERLKTIAQSASNLSKPSTDFLQQLCSTSHPVFMPTVKVENNEELSETARQYASTSQKGNFASSGNLTWQRGKLGANMGNENIYSKKFGDLNTSNKKSEMVKDLETSTAKQKDQQKQTVEDKQKIATEPSTLGASGLFLNKTTKIKFFL